jgi:hypothetical protein
VSFWTCPLSSIPREHNALKADIFFVLPEYWTMDKIQKLGNLKCNIESLEAHRSVLCNRTFFFGVYLLQILILFILY